MLLDQPPRLCVQAPSIDDREVPLALLAGDPELVLVAALSVLHTVVTLKAVVAVSHIWS